MIWGTCDSRFQSVADAFERNFRERGEVGAAVSVTLAGEPVVDLWGGVRSRSGEEWEADTICGVRSVTKGATALCAHILADRGLLDLDAPVADYWPEFACNGKAEIPVRLLLSHQSGLAALPGPLPPGAYYDWAYMVRTLAEAAPLWEPGTRVGYHTLTFGWLVGELVRRASGKSLGQFFQAEVARPLGLDFWIGLPEALEPRVARLFRAAREPAPSSPPEPISVLALENGLSSGYYREMDSRAAHAAEIGGAGGITNARSIARMFAPLANGGSLGAVRLVGSRTLARMSAVAAATERDATFGFATRFSLGFMKSMNTHSRVLNLPARVIMSEDAFGHVGFGGSMGFAAPAHRLSFGYTMTNMGVEPLLSDRGQSLIDAAYASIGVTDLLA